MKELDLVLLRYLREQWPSAQAAQQAAFERLLELPDPLLADYLFGRAVPSDVEIRELIGRIRIQ